MSELKPCPFCGGIGTLWSIDQCDTVYAVCQNCGARTVDYKYAEEAISAWNRRAQPANEPLTLEQLREMDGEPVWCVDCLGNQCWALVNVADDECIDKETGAWCMGLYGVSDKPVDLTGWLAYRRHPERSENE